MAAKSQLNRRSLVASLAALPIGASPAAAAIASAFGKPLSAEMVAVFDYPNATSIRQIPARDIPVWKERGWTPIVPRLAHGWDLSSGKIQKTYTRIEWPSRCTIWRKSEPPFAVFKEQFPQDEWNYFVFRANEWVPYDRIVIGCYVSPPNNYLKYETIRFSDIPNEFISARDFPRIVRSLDHLHALDPKRCHSIYHFELDDVRAAKRREDELQHAINEQLSAQGNRS